MRAMKGLQLIKICEQLWAVVLNASNERVAADQNLRAVMDCSIRGRAMKGLQLIKIYEQL